MTALAVAGLAAPVAAQSSAPLESAAPVAERPMLAPEGWMLATVESRRGSRVQIDVLAVAPDGDIRSVATIDDVVRDPGAGRDLRRADEWWDTPISTVTTDGYLPVPLEWNDDSVDAPMLLRVFDLLAPDPAVMATDLERTPERLYAWDTVRSGSDGRLSVSNRGAEGEAEDGRVGATLVLDPVTSTTEDLPPFGTGYTVRGPDWLADSSGWPARVDDTRGTLSSEGVFSPGSPPMPLLDLARGARQVAASGRGLGTWDSGQGPPGFVRPEECRLWWSGPPGEDPSGRLTVWWDRCRDRGRVLDIRWDVDGVGVLVLAERRGRIELLRRDRPRQEELIASFPSARIASTRQDNSRSVRVLGLAPGPRRGELLLAFTPVDHVDSIFFLSTIEQELIEVKGGRPSDSVSFAGFSVPPSDRIPPEPPLTHRAESVPDGMLAPTDWMFVWVGGQRSDLVTSPIRVIAMSDQGEVREVATIDGLPGPGRQVAEGFEHVMRVTTTGFLPIPTRAMDAEEATADRVDVVDLRAPDRPPLVLEDEPDMIHGWRWLTSAPSGFLSIPAWDGP